MNTTLTIEHNILVVKYMNTRDRLQNVKMIQGDQKVAHITLSNYILLV
jgi:hypothetical protein